MRKQIFEILPNTEDLHGHYEVLRYENSAQRAEIAELESEVERLKTLVDTLEEKLDEQQEVIDLLTTEMVQLRPTKAPG